MLSRISNEFGVTLTVQDLFKHPSITSMGKLIDLVKAGKQVEEISLIQDVDLNREVDKHDQATLIKYVVLGSYI